MLASTNGERDDCFHATFFTANVHFWRQAGYFEADSATSPLPSYLALAPVVGTVLLLLFGTNQTFVGRILATRPMVTVGLMSYSAYLWHQPLFAFVRIRTAQDRLTPSLTVASIAITFVIAFCSWRWIEQPFRRGGSVTAGPRRILAVAGLALVLVGGSAQVLAATIDGTPSDVLVASSVDVEVLKGADAAAELGVSEVAGSLTIVRPVSGGSECAVLAFGDSHTGHLAPGLTRRLVPSTDCELHLWTLAGCPSLLGYSKIYDLDERSLPERELECRRQAEVWDDYVRRSGSRYDAAIMSSRWNWMIGDSDYGDGKAIRRDAVVEVSTDLSTIGDLDDAQRLSNLANALDVTVTRLREQIPTVIVLSQPPVQLFDLRNLNVGPAFIEAAPERELAARRHRLWTTAVDQSGIESIDGVVYVDLFDELFCPDPVGRCRNLVDRIPLYRDDDHLSGFGSELVADAVLRRLGELGITPGS